AVVVLASDHGLRHPERDPLSEATIRSRELRLSFRLGGDLTRCFLRRWEDDEDALLVQDEQVRFIVRPVLDRFGEERFHWDRPELKLADEIQAVAYRGEEKRFELLKLGDCFACFTLSAWPREQKSPNLGRVQTRLANGRLQA